MDQAIRSESGTGVKLSAGTRASEHPSQQQPESGRRVLVVDDVLLTREGLTDLLSAHGFTASGCGSTESSLDEALVRFEPDVTMLNAATVDIVAVSEQARLCGRAVVVAVGVVERADEIVRCARARLAGFTLASEPIGTLVDLIATADASQTQCPAAAVPMLMAAASRESSAVQTTNLSPREREVLQLAAQGLANKAIASRLGITLRTVKNHLHHAYGKLDVHSRTEAAAVVRTDDPRHNTPRY